MNILENQWEEKCPLRFINVCILKTQVKKIYKILYRRVGFLCFRTLVQSCFFVENLGLFSLS